MDSMTEVFRLIIRRTPPEKFTLVKFDTPVKKLYTIIKIII